MPCDSEYLEPRWDEREASRLYAINAELFLGIRVNPETYGNGYWNGKYATLSNMGKQYRDAVVKRICDHLKQTRDVSKYSLEVQMWWRDHQLADKVRELKNEK